MAQDAADHTRLFDERDQPQTPPHRGQASTPHPTAHNTRGGDPGSKPKLRSINSAHSRFVRGYADAGALSGFARVRVMSSQYSAAWRRKNGWLTNHGVVSYTNTDSSRANIGMYPTFRRLSSAALVAATGGAARVMKLDRQLGTLQPEKWADLIVLNANPLMDITNTRQIDSVWMAGRRLPR